MITRTHTHNGNCQVCGREQASDNRTTRIAKHGYTVEGGYFSGTCYGSGALPLQIERRLTDNTIRSLIRQRRDNVKTVRALAAGTTHPAKVGNYTDEFHAERNDRYEVVMIAWADANNYARERGVKLSIAQLESESRFLRSHGRAMYQLAARLHGTKLIPAITEPKVKPAKAVVDIKAATVTGTFTSKAARKDALDRINREFEKQTRKLQEIFLAIPHDNRTEAQSEVYDCPMYPHQWNAKHSAAALREFPQAQQIVTEIEKLITARKVVKEAP